MTNHCEFEQAAIPHMAVLHNYALHLTMDSENAKDLLQDTYLKAYRFWDHFERGTNIRAWLYQIMKNSHINLYRKETKEPKTVCYEEYHLPYHITQEASFANTDLSEKSYDEVFGDEITRSIESIKDAFRRVVFLADVEGLTYDEIARTVDCPIGTVRSRLFRGRRLLKKRLFVYAKGNGFIPKKARL
jgi:RNA polymerase sigma-70 factor, ECF subfamily